ncbi:MAG: transcription-repair coupling factor [Oscillospiraceae bacterium]|nr:transcription-repair coupling factor [Oscillospiraceae bacterium]
MKTINQAILENKEAAALPLLLESGGLPALVSGLSNVHRSFLAAALRERLGMPLFVVCPDESAADSLRRDLEAMTGEEVLLLNSRDFTFFSSVAASRQAEQQRIFTLDRLSRGEAPICVATVSALMQRSIPPEVLRAAAFTLADGGECSPEELERALLRNGYTRTEQVEGAGQYARRGGILDFFSPMYPEPVRVEFWGDDIDSMGFFDVQSQRRTEQVSEVCILPAAEALISLSKSGPEALVSALEAMAASCEKRKNSPQQTALAVTLRQDAERIRSGVRLTDADRYLPLLYEESYGADYIPEAAFVVFDQPSRCADRGKSYIRILGEDVNALLKKGMSPAPAERFRMDWDALCRRLADFPVYMADAFTVGRYPLEPKTLCSVPAKQLPSYGGSAKTACDDVKLYLKQGFRVVVLAGDRRRAETLQSFFRENGVRAMLYPELESLPGEGSCVITLGAVSAGAEYPNLRLAVITDSQLQRVRTADKKRRKTPSKQQRINSYADLSAGDLVVHESHGIGRFAGIVRMKVDGFDKDYIKICYAGSDVLYVPATQLDLVTKYLGAGEDKPVKLSKMGGTEWSRVRTRAKGAAKDMARKLIQLYAQRLRLPGHAFAADTPWQREFEDNFGYTETDDQLRCIAEIKADMEAGVPMDRLLCGDVGYGKTEVALRAAMKCIMDNRQAAILVPTTVLAQQHYQTAVQRFFGFPVNVEVLSRFRSPAQISQTLTNLRSGKCDLVIGTHRLLQKDVKFKELGLLIVDEEQRFGVTHKEHIKELSHGVDVLTLSATPIPRTLNMALSGIRDMSTIDEPPQDRLPVQTFVMEHDWGIICDAISRELSRGGQVYYLHNRIDNIERTALRLKKLLEELCGEVTVGVAHGQMDREQLASVMEEVAEGRVQILVCTTIIETGIDIPNVNTLIIEDADRMGLAQLHQIRGRVGRSTRRASAYLTFRQDKVLTEVAEKRLTAIREFAEFGSGFKIAMRDLEIRGAGNLLGAEQSGNMLSVGYDMYLKLLEEAVLEERGIKPEKRAECSADLSVAANIPESYIPAAEQRMDIYRRIALIRTEEEADDLTDELIDRFGDPPPGVNALIHVALLRGEAGRAGISDISQKSGALRFVLEDFDMGRISWLYAKPEYKGRLKVEAGAKPCVSLKLRSKNRTVDEARRFVSDWNESKNA